MVETPNPRDFKTFATWLERVVKGPHKLRSQKEISLVANVQPQMVTKWLKKTKPNPSQLQAIASDVGVLYEDLRSLVDGVKIKSAGDLLGLHGLPRTAEASLLGAEWGKITDEHIRKAIFDLIHVVVASEKRAERKDLRSSSEQPGAARQKPRKGIDRGTQAPD